MLDSPELNLSLTRKGLRPYQKGQHMVTGLPDIFRTNANYYYRSSGRTKQSWPYIVPTAYSLREVRMRSSPAADPGPNADFGTDGDSKAAALRSRQFAYNKAYERFVAKLGDSSSFGATLTAERRETFGMISGFVTRALLSARAAKRRDVAGVLLNLGFNPPLKRVTRTFRRKNGRRYRQSQEYYMMPNGRAVLKEAASAWLLWSYGISPLLSDIHNATDVFIRAVPDSVKIRASAKETFKDSFPRIYQFDEWRWFLTGSVKVSLTADVVVNNYDLWLANQLGLINPLQFLNEAVPFSFVVDWFSNWSSVINALSDFHGLTLSNHCTSDRIEWKDDTSYYTYVRPDVAAKVRELKINIVIDGLAYKRALGSFSSPKLMFRYERFEWRRALNAISLLVNFLPSTKK